MKVGYQISDSLDVPAALTASLLQRLIAQSRQTPDTAALLRRLLVAPLKVVAA